MRVLVAPDKFRGTLTAAEAAAAIAAGCRAAVPSAVVDEAPLGDGGEGTMDALVAALGGRTSRVRVTGPLGDPVDAEFGILPDGTAVVEMARASGLALLAPSRRAPMRTTTRGTGELILAAARAGSRRILLCVGGSATNDGGAGMAQAIGVRMLDAHGRDLRPGGVHLLELASIDMTGLDPAVQRLTTIVATDVRNPLTGPSGAAAVYGPQKGASAADVATLDAALGHLAAVIHRDLGIDVRDLEGAGAAGGLGAGAVAFLGARLRSGAEVVMDAVGFGPRLDAADVVVTAEGRFDAGSLAGKVPGAVISAARAARVPVAVLCGTKRIDAEGALGTWSLDERFGRQEALERAAPSLRRLAAEVVSEVADRLRPEARVARGD